MDGSPTAISWIPISALAARFKANVAALATREPDLADRIVNHSPKDTYHIFAGADSIQLGTGRAGEVRPLPNPVSPAGVQQLLSQLTAGKQLAGPLVVAGLDHGWLWDALSKLDIKVPAAPGHRTPIYFLVPDIERLWVVLHLHDWRTLLADRGCIILAGHDAADQLQQFLIDHPEVAWPRTAITTDASMWPAGRSLDTTLAAADARIKQLLDDAIARINRHQSSPPGLETIAERFRSGTPLRFLGITSRYTTFLQHSMRDWLAGMESLGHSTRLLIEQHNHERPHPLLYLQAIAEFQPDLILLIDHYRAELPLMPTHIPCVMWVQDRLPNIFNSKAGAAQGPLDFCLGFGRGECVGQYRYPGGRYMEAPVGVNEQRFTRPKLTGLRKFACDVAFVSHASMSPRQLIEEQITRLEGAPDARRLFQELHDRLAAIYDAGGAVTAEEHLRKLVQKSIDPGRIDAHAMQPIMEFVIQRLNNAFFRHQSIAWVVESGASLALYGRGWEQHPRFAPFARGVADNQTQLCDIYRSARINLQITPFGAAHQRTFEGLCGGAFFLFRQTDGDRCERIYQSMWDWCRQHGISNDKEIVDHRDARVRQWLEELSQLRGCDRVCDAGGLFGMLESLAGSGFTRAASTLFDEFDQVAFSTRDQLHQLLRRFLSDETARSSIAGRMRDRVIETVTYTGISRRLLEFIAGHLVQKSDAEWAGRAA